jgi:hypothetical protein
MNQNVIIFFSFFFLDPPRTDPPFGMLLEEAEKVIEDRKQHATTLLEPIVADLKKRNLVRARISTPHQDYFVKHVC